MFMEYKSVFVSSTVCIVDVRITHCIDLTLLRVFVIRCCAEIHMASYSLVSVRAIKQTAKENTGTALCTDIGLTFKA